VTTPLRSCPACSRHVRLSELACPFCGLGLDEAFRVAPTQRAPSGRLSRAALVAFGASGLVASSACGTTAASNPPYDAEPACGTDAADCVPDVSSEASIEAAADSASDAAATDGAGDFRVIPSDAAPEATGTDSSAADGGQCDADISRFEAGCPGFPASIIDCKAVCLAPPYGGPVQE
jgi:hypothetical protein